MSSKNTAKSCALCRQLLEANQLLLAANQQFLARISQLELDLAQAQARAQMSAPPVVTAEKVDKPELAFMDAEQMNDQPDFPESGDAEAIRLSDDKQREADRLFDEAFAEIKQQIDAGHAELAQKGLIGEPVGTSV